MAGEGPDRKPEVTRPFDLAFLANDARPREVTSATFSYVDAMLAGRMSDTELDRIRDEILGDSSAEASPPPPAEPDPTAAIQDLVAARDFSGGLALAEALLERSPGLEAAHHLAEVCRRSLADLYQAHVGAGHDVPHLAVEPASLGDHGIDRWAAYLVSRFDGQSSIDELIDLTGFTRLDTLRLLYELLQRGIVRVERRAAPEPQPPSSAQGSVLARVKLKRVR
jgi:hypothetical protein